MLRDALAENPDWPAAADAYAAQHTRYAAALHRTLGLYDALVFDIGPEADERRARALPLIGEDPTRMIDFIGLGPDAPNDAAAERRMFGNE